jgi:hypothetical protein
MFDLPIRAGVHHGGPIDSDVVVIAEPEEFLSCKLLSLSVMMEFGTPKRWLMSRKNSTACLDLIVVIDQASIHFVNLSMVTSRCV